MRCARSPGTAASSCCATSADGCIRGSNSTTSTHATGYAFGPAIKPALERWSGVLSNAVLVVLVLAVVWFVIGRVRRLSRTRAASG